MLIKDLTDYYNHNPPEPIIPADEKDPSDITDIVAEHLYEETYEEQSKKSYVDIDEIRDIELIRHEQFGEI